mgnify:CR=1 FL=1
MCKNFDRIEHFAVITLIICKLFKYWPHFAMSQPAMDVQFDLLKFEITIYMYIYNGNYFFNGFASCCF